MNGSEEQLSLMVMKAYSAQGKTDADYREGEIAMTPPGCDRGMEGQSTRRAIPRSGNSKSSRPVDTQ